jgi:hypothetical protein
MLIQIPSLGASPGADLTGPNLVELTFHVYPLDASPSTL